MLAIRAAVNSFSGSWYKSALELSPKLPPKLLAERLFCRTALKLEAGGRMVVSYHKVSLWRIYSCYTSWVKERVVSISDLHGLPLSPLPTRLPHPSNLPPRCNQPQKSCCLLTLNCITYYSVIPAQISHEWKTMNFGDKTVVSSNPRSAIFSMILDEPQFPHLW